jgi:uncharacterized phage protein gp47/JayE
MQAIYGSDIVLDPSSQDGQMIAIFAQAMSDANDATIATYNSFSPTFAQGAGLSSLVKINGLRRLLPSLSTAVGNVVGQAGTIITNGQVTDVDGNVWNLPATVTIPGGGSISVTVTAAQAGAIVEAIGNINQISTPTRGWQSFTNTSQSTPGAPVETDAALRQRQAISTSIPSQTTLSSLYGALANLPGVTRVAVYENYTNTTDGNGLPAHSISAVIAGGVNSQIVQTIGQLKTPGAATYGTTTGTYMDPITGITYTINYYVLASSEIKVAVTGTAMNGYSSLIATEIQNAVAAYLNSLAVGQDVQFSRMYAPAYLNGAADSNTYEITGLTIALGAGSPGTSDIVVPFNSAAVCVAATDVTVSIS